MYSPETVNQIIALHQDIESSWQTKLMRSIPDIGHKTLIFGVELWQLFGLLVLILLSIVFKKIFTWIVSRFISHYVVRFGREEIAQQFIVQSLSLLV